MINVWGKYFFLFISHQVSSISISKIEHAVTGNIGAENATQDVLFALSRQDAINWRSEYDYLLTNNRIYSKRWWCRTGR